MAAATQQIRPPTAVIARRTASKVLAYTLTTAVAVLMIVPFVWLVRTSLMTLDQTFVFPPPLIPDPWVPQNYPDALTTQPFGQYLINTLTILVPVVLGATITSALAAFGFSHLRWPGRDLLFGILLTTLMLPYAVTLIPTFLVWTSLNAINTFWPLTLPAWFGGGIFNIFLLRQFFRTLPHELDEAAYLDGCNPIQVLWHVVLPLSKPALITVVIFTGLGVWNDFLGPLIYLNDPNKYTLAIGLAQFMGTYHSEWNLMMAASTVIIVPVVLIFFLSQRYFVEGITLTGMK